MNLKDQDLSVFLEVDDPLSSMRKDFVSDLRKYIADKKIEIGQWVPAVLKNYPNNG